MKYCAMKEINQLVKALIRQDWLFTRRGKHGCISPPQGFPRICVPCTPSDKRAFLNFRRDIRHVTRIAPPPARPT